MSTSEQRTIRFRCPRCFGQQEVPAERAGGTHRCPLCHTACKVPLVSQVESHEDPYAVAEEAVAPSAAAPRQYIGVECSLCGTRMYAEPGEVGKSLVCPDCGTSTVVRAPAPQQRKSPAHRTPATPPDDDYALANDALPAEAAPGHRQPEYFAVHCPVCDTLMQFTEAEVGQRVVCSDCQVPLTVPTPPKKKLAPKRREIDPYEVREEAEPPGLALAQRHWVPQTPPEDETPEPTKPVAKDRDDELSLGVFFRGNLSFLLSAEAIGHGLFLVAMLWTSVALAGGPAGGLGSAVPWIAAMIFTAIAALLFIMWFALAAASGLTVFRDTAGGGDRIDEWPNMMAFTEWFGEVFYVFNSAACAVLLGLVVQQVVTRLGGPALPIATGLAVAVWPVLVMSMLEGDTALKPLTVAVLRSLWQAKAAWFVFYLLYLPLLAVAIACVVGVLVGHLVFSPLFVGLFVAVWLVVFRLLGHLAWWCERVDRQWGEED